MAREDETECGGVEGGQKQVIIFGWKIDKRGYKGKPRGLIIIDRVCVTVYEMESCFRMILALEQMSRHLEENYTPDVLNRI